MSRDLLRPLLNDLIGLQRHLHEATERQLGSDALAEHWDAKNLLKRLVPRLEANAAALGQALEHRGGRISPVKQGLGALTGIAAGWLDRLRAEHEITRDLRDDYVVLSLLIVSYGVLNAAAAAQEDAETADLAGDHLDGLVSLLDELRIVLPEVALREFSLADDGAGSGI